MSKIKFCPECSGILTSRLLDEHHRMVCVNSTCGYVYWDSPIPVVAALVQHQNKILLARNTLWPQGLYSLITGYLEKMETTESAVIREVKEELGLDGERMEFIGCFSLFEMNQIIIAYWVSATGDIRLGDEIADIKALSVEELKSWKFGHFVLTSAIVDQWLGKTAPN